MNFLPLVWLTPVCAKQSATKPCAISMPEIGLVEGED
jgi:hypothetical protein